MFELFSSVKSAAPRVTLVALLSSGLLACGGGSSSDSSGDTVADSDGNQSCGSQSAEVAWQALMEGDEPYLSRYRLFQDPCNPTTAANSDGVPYDLSTALFTDYSSKYRFMFIPPGEQAQYSENEVLEFPVGTVISKTFALPADTSNRGFDNETLVETRLLIRRSNGWVALPYVWNEAQTDATLARAGKQFTTSIIHNGQQLDFTYGVPDTGKCKQCHQLENSQGNSVFSPIGPKARLLNHDFDYDSGIANQLTYLADNNRLTGLPVDLGSLLTVPAFDDLVDVQNLSDQELTAAAKGYLDINCAHCHRPEGGASNTGLYLEFWRSFDGNQQAHGVCKRPVAYGGGSLSYDLVPGDADNSIIHYRMNSREPGDKMPEVGRDLVHQEGVALIRAWINALPGNDCST